MTSRTKLRPVLFETKDYVLTTDTIKSDIQLNGEVEVYVIRNKHTEVVEGRGMEQFTMLIGIKAMQDTLDAVRNGEEPPEKPRGLN